MSKVLINGQPVEMTLQMTAEEAAAVMTPVPNKPKTPVRNFRIPEEIYGPARDRAAERGETVTDVVKRALVRYAKAKKGEE